MHYQKSEASHSILAAGTAWKTNKTSKNFFSLTTEQNKLNSLAGLAGLTSRARVKIEWPFDERGPMALTLGLG